MSWKTEPRIADCCNIARRWNKKQVIIIAIDDEGRIDLATYGETKQLCAVAKTLGEVALKSVNTFIAIVDSAIDRNR